MFKICFFFALPSGVCCCKGAVSVNCGGIGKKNINQQRCKNNTNNYCTYGSYELAFAYI